MVKSTGLVLEFYSEKDCFESHVVEYFGARCFDQLDILPITKKSRDVTHGTLTEGETQYR
jgi:hypothetical protein